MATKKYYIGTHGPFVYEDTDLVGDPDGDFSGETVRGLTTDQAYVSDAPGTGEEVVRLDDIEVTARRYTALANPASGFTLPNKSGSTAKLPANPTDDFRYMFMMG